MLHVRREVFRNGSECLYEEWGSPRPECPIILKGDTLIAECPV